MDTNLNNIIKNATDVEVTKSVNHKLKDSDVIQIWDEVSSYIFKFMVQSKGVTIPNFGTFTFIQKKIEIGNNKFILAQRPAFVIAEKFSQTHGLSAHKQTVSGQIPIHPLNYSSIAQETAFTRDDVDACVRHVLQVFNRSIQSGKNVEFKFNSIGQLTIRNGKIKMIFYKDFVNSCDASGKVVNDMQNVNDSFCLTF
jgi:nucleoid DNA-binding protein